MTISDNNNNDLGRFQKIKKAAKLLDQYLSEKETAVLRKYNSIRERHPIIVEAAKLTAAACLPQMASQIQSSFGSSVFTQKDMENFANSATELLTNLNEIEKQGEKHFYLVNRRVEQQVASIDLGQLNEDERFQLISEAIKIHTKENNSQIEIGITNLNRIINELGEIKRSIYKVESTTRTMSSKVDDIHSAMYSQPTDPFLPIWRIRDEIRTIRTLNLRSPNRKTKAMILGVSLIGVSTFLAWLFYLKIIGFESVVLVDVAGIALFLYSYASKVGPLKKTPLLGYGLFIVVMILSVATLLAISVLTIFESRNNQLMTVAIVSLFAFLAEPIALEIWARWSEH